MRCTNVRIFFSSLLNDTELTASAVLWLQAYKAKSPELFGTFESIVIEFGIYMKHQ
jgi:hypothetical protein